MAQSHWLDPLARKVLKFTDYWQSQHSQSFQGNLLKKEAVEIDLINLKQGQNKARVMSSFSVDVNRATASDWMQLPGCTKDMIDLLLKLQKGGVQLSGHDDLFKLLELPPELAKEWNPHLVFQWYGDSPQLSEKPLIDLNCASQQTLQKVLNWSKERVMRLIKERQRRSFENLADLQERLTLPPTTIENLIGVVCFSEKRAGPILPPKI